MFDDRFLESFVKTSAVPIQDLSWLDIDEDEYAANERLPDNRKTLNIKDQLRILWDHHIDRGPGRFNLIPNVEKPPTGTELAKESSEDLADLEKRVKTAMMHGITGPALVKFIKAKFARDTIEASSEILEKLALEQGVLGFAYVDPDLLDCQKATKFGSSFKVPEFVKASEKCVDCKFASEKTCLKLEMPIVSELQYTPELVGKLKKKLEAHGFSFEDDSTLEPKKRLQLIFLSRYIPAVERSNHYVAPRKERIEVSEEEITQFLAESTLKAEKNAKQLALEKIGKAKFQVLSFLRRSLIAGQHIDDIIPALKRKYAQDTLKLAKEEIRALVKAHGFFGNLYVTLDTFSKCASLAEFLKKSGSLARYLVKNAKCAHCTSNQEERCLELGLPLVENFEEIKIDQPLVNSYVNELMNRGKISQEVAEDLLDSTNWPESLKKLLKSKSLQQPLRGGHVVQEHILAQNSSGLSKHEQDQETQKFLLTSTKTALEEGVGIRALQNKLSTLVPSNVGSYILERALKEAALISADSFKYCQKLGNEGFELNKQAHLLIKEACGDCIFNSKVYCTKIGNRFKNRNFEVKKEAVVDTTADELKEFYQGSKVSVKMATKRKALEGEIEGLNEFTIG